MAIFKAGFVLLCSQCKELSDKCIQDSEEFILSKGEACDIYLKHG